ncbi:S8 family peptidase [Actinomadura fibrosa]|uniref:S8 family serine peptidase n=1 Tax=Actinomadura fibrosa TaxID=111802 RepID=A0ABW2XYN1_9ACTN|nr:S8 family serine peptidase [Actinomadura fibrosa]
MSHAGRRRVRRPRPAARLGARATATLGVLTLTAAVAVPAALAPDDAAKRARPVSGAAAGPLLGAPTDQIRAREWHLGVLRAQRAWKWSRGSGVTVAVLDTGVDRRHPDLTGRVVSGPDLTGGGRRPGSRYWGLHGTSMASIIAGHGHGPGFAQGMIGVAPQSRILSIRVTLENDDPLRQSNGQAGGDTDAVAQGIRYAVDHGANIVNMSLGGGQQHYNGTPQQEAAIKYALGKGVVLIASAGNDGSSANRKNFPAAYPGVIAVGALDRRLRLWKDSNRRSHASVCAPGVDIVSADSSNGYVVGTGTSASSAMVAGVAALIRARYPKLSPEDVRRALVQGSPARAGHPTGSTACSGTVDAVQSLVAASKLNKTGSGPVRNPEPTASPEPEAVPEESDSSLLLPAVLGGGGVLIIVGLVLGWRQRRRPEDEPDEGIPEYGLPSAPPREAVAASAAPPYGGAPGHPAGAPMAPAPGAPSVAPVNAPLWQSTEVYSPPATPGPPPEYTGPPPVPSPSVPELSGNDVAATSAYDQPSPGLVEPPPPVLDDSARYERPAVYEQPAVYDDPAATYDDPPAYEDPADGRPGQPPVMASELRPFVPGEFSTNGTNGLHGDGLVNGNGGAPNGKHHGPSSSGEGLIANGHDFLNGHDLGNGNGGSGGGNGHVGNGQFGAGLHGLPPGPGLGEPGLGEPGLEDAAPVPDEPAAFDDDEWERFRRSALGEPDAAGGVPPSAPPPPPPIAPPSAPPPVPPSVPPAEVEDDESRGRHSRPPRPPDDEDYRPPWW